MRAKVQIAATCWLIVAASSSAIGQTKASEHSSATTTGDRSSKVLTLGEVNGESDDEFSTVNVRLNRAPTWTMINRFEDHGSFIQLILPKTLVPNPGSFIEGNSPYIKKIALFQLTAQDAAVRLFVTEKASIVLAATEAELLGQRIVITVDHKIVKESAISLANLATAPAETDRIKTDRIKADKSKTGGAVTVSAKGNQSLSKAQLEKVLAAGIQDSNNQKPSTKLGMKSLPAGSQFDLRGKLIQVVLFLGGLIGLLVAVRLFKGRQGPNGRPGTTKEALQLQTLATLNLAPKQKISVVQVGNQQILLGLTPDSVNFLTHLSGEEVFGGMAPTRTQNLVPASQPLISTGQDSPPSVPTGQQGFKSPDHGEPSPRLGSRDNPPVFTNSSSDSDRSSFRNTLHNHRSEQPSVKLKNHTITGATGPQAEKKTFGRAWQKGSQSLPGSSKTSNDTLDLEGRVGQQPTNNLNSNGATGTSGSPPAKRINLAIGDSGVEELTSKTPTSKVSSTDDSQKAIDDVTKLIREKLKTLRNI